MTQTTIWQTNNQEQQWKRGWETGVRWSACPRKPDRVSSSDARVESTFKEEIRDLFVSCQPIEWTGHTWLRRLSANDA